MSLCLCICVAGYLCPCVSDYVWDSALASHFTLPLSPDTPQLPASFTARNGFRSLPAVWIPTGPAACPGSCPCGLCSRLDLGSDTLWKAPNMLLAWPWTQRSYSGEEGQGGKGGAVGRAHPSFWKQRSLSGPFPGPVSLPMLSSRPSIQGPGLTVSGDRNEQSSAGPARAIGIWSSVSPSTLHSCIVFIPHLPT